jgi:hypothetical protein
MGAFFVGMKVCLSLPFAEQAAFCVCSPWLFFFPPYFLMVTAYD